MTQLPKDHRSNIKPVTSKDRIIALDVLRGFAVLGILVMNIQSFSMVDPTYFNPTVSKDLGGVNLLVWFFSHILVDQKFMAIFSMLFGAGVVLACSRVEERGGKPARFHYRRTFFLLLFGILHAYLLWVGDILVWYSLTAFVAYLFWRMRPGWLVFWAVSMLLIGTSLYGLFQMSLPYWPPEAVEENVAYWDPPEEVIEHRLEVYRSGWVAQLSERVPTALVIHTFVWGIWGFWRVLGMMLLGMAFFKWGVLSAERSDCFYARAAAAGFGVGLPLVVFGVWRNFTHDWAMEYSMFGGTLPNYWGSVLVAIGFISLVMLAVRREWFTALQDKLAPVGRIAFTSYILQTVICTTIFFGHGFGLYGRVERWQQALVVGAVWCLVVVFANFWLRRFRMGPLEWLWRALTYGKRPPMKNQ